MELYKRHRPKKLSQVVGQDVAVKILETKLRRETLPHTILFHGPSGCLRGDTSIFDPIDNSNLSIYDRWTAGLPFHVLSLSCDGILEVAEALPPVRYSLSQMFRVETSEAIFYVTSEHRFLAYTGEYLSLKELLSVEFSSIPLLSIEGLSQAVRLQGGHHYQKKELNYLDHYPHDHHYDDEPPLSFLGNDLAETPLLNDVPVRTPLYLQMGVQDNAVEHTHPHLHSDPPSMPDSYFQDNFFVQQLMSLSDGESGVRHESQHHTSSLVVSEFPPVNNTLKLQHRQNGIKDETTLFPYGHKLPLAYLRPFIKRSTFTKTIIKDISPVGKNHFFDFHVPKNNNYWTGDIFHHNCGKTTLARILRRELKCGSSDFVEMNAANDRGIDPTREIQSKMNASPLDGECRIWLIDECQMLNGYAQSNLLKTLEDTPDHVYFMLATTDPQKLLKTIRTRCMEVPLKPLTFDDLSSLIRDVAKKEDVSIPSEVIEKIAEMSDGSARRALVLLDSVYQLNSEDEMLESVNRKTSETQAIQIARALINPRTRWSEMASLLKGLEGEEPEQLRHMVLGYAKSVMLGGGAMTGRAYIIISSFANHLYDSKMPGFVASCYEVIEGSKK